MTTAHPGSQCYAPPVRAQRALLTVGLAALSGCAHANTVAALEASNLEMQAQLDELQAEVAASQAALEATTQALALLTAEREAREQAEREHQAELEARRLERQQNANRYAIEGADQAIACDDSVGNEWSCTVQREFLNRVVADPGVLHRQARIVPSQRDGQTRGYKLYGIRRGSVPKLLRLKNGDMITAVGETELSSIDATMGVWVEFRAERVEIRGVRKANDFRITLTVE